MVNLTLKWKPRLTTQWGDRPFSNEERSRAFWRAWRWESRLQRWKSGLGREETVERKAAEVEMGRNLAGRIGCFGHFTGGQFVSKWNCESRIHNHPYSPVPVDHPLPHKLMNRYSKINKQTFPALIPSCGLLKAMTLVFCFVLFPRGEVLMR